MVTKIHPMAIASPSLSELHAFVAAARLGTFLKASEVLCVTPGAVSRAISRMEGDLGCQLFRRHVHGCELTAQGREYLAMVAPALDALESAATKAKVKPASSVLRLSVTPTLASHWLIRRLPEFHQQHPEISLEFVPYRPGDYPLLAAQGASLCGGNGHWPEGLEATYVVGRPIVPVCRPGDLTGPEPLLRPSDLLKRPLLFHALHPNTWRNWFETIGCFTSDQDAMMAIQPVASFDQVSQLLEAAVSGLGIAMVQRCLIEDYLEAGKLVIPFAERVNNDRGYFFCYPESLRRTPAVEALGAWLVKHGELSDAR